MEVPTQKIEETGMYFFYREDIAKWYGISQRGLRKRFQKEKLVIKSRILTIKEIWAIFKVFGLPHDCPAKILSLIILMSTM